MRKKVLYRTTSINKNDAKEGETLETKITRILTNGEPVKDGAPLIYTERKEGVLAGYNIRTDRFEVAVEATDKIHKSNLAKRENKPTDERKVINLNGEAESTQGTN